MKNNSRLKSTRFTILIGMLCAVYLLFSVGVVKATHFCMGKEASVSFFSTDTEKCACSLSGLEKTACCDDEHALLKLQDSQKNFSFFHMGLPVLTFLGEIYSSRFDPGTEVTQYGVNASDPPPIEITLYKLYCKYVFYDD